MSVVAIGVNHHTAPLAVLESMALTVGDLGKALHALLSRPHLSEAVVLSTCNRTEVYAVAEKFHGGYEDVRAALGELAFLEAEDFADHLYVHHDTAAVSHLFDVVSGLDSAVLGEHEIQGQVKAAWEAAQGEDAVGPHLNLLFRHALEAGKRVRTETGIGTGTASVSYAAVALAARTMSEVSGRDGLSGCSALVLGAGDMGRSMAASLSAAAVADVVVANRTHDKAVALAESVGGRAIRFADVVDTLVDVDVVLTSTGSTSVLVTREAVAEAVARRDGRPLALVDIAVPRDVDPAVAEIDGVTLHDMAAISSFAAIGMETRTREVTAARAILDEEIDRFAAAQSARSVAPLIVALRDAAEAHRAAEFERTIQRLDGLSDEQAEQVEALTKGLVAKLLHHPTVALRDAAGTAKGDRLVQAMRDIYGFDA